jgi:LPXTG-site transpeptidase (sortase) family protein
VDNTSADFRRQIRALRLLLGVVTGAICLFSAACSSTPSPSADVAAPPPNVVPTAAATLAPPNPTVAPTVPPTPVVVPTALPTSTPVRIPTAPPTVAPTATSVPTTVPLPEAAVPVSISIPRLHSSADIVPLGLEADGSMAAPTDPDTIGWYKLGAKVGRPGNAVVVGHVDWGGRLRAFGLLRTLRAGDKVTVVDALEREFTYSVQSVGTVSADTAPDEYLTQGGAMEEELTLITCGGEFDHTTHQYLSRVIVQAFRDTDSPSGAAPGGG